MQGFFAGEAVGAVAIANTSFTVWGPNKEGSTFKTRSFQLHYVDQL